MELKNLPPSVQTYWNSLSHQEQREVLTCLGQNMKPLNFVLKVDCTISTVGQVMAYLRKHQISYEVKKVGQKVHFIFNKHGLRNEVLIGMNCL